MWFDRAKYSTSSNFQQNHDIWRPILYTYITFKPNSIVFDHSDMLSSFIQLHRLDFCWYLNQIWKWYIDNLKLKNNKQILFLFFLVSINVKGVFFHTKSFECIKRCVLSLWMSIETFSSINLSIYVCLEIRAVENSFYSFTDKK